MVDKIFNVPYDSLVPYRLETSNDVISKKGDLITLRGFTDIDVTMRVVDIDKQGESQILKLELVEDE